MRFILLCCCFVVSSGLLQTVSASTPEEKLAQLLASVNGVSATFTQHIRDPLGNLLEASQGQLYLDKPNFRWDVESPFPQTIVATGSELKIYDPDLEQLTVQPLDPADGFDVPLAILTQSKVDLAGEYAVSMVEVDGLQRFQLTPRDPDSLFARLDFAFDREFLHAFTIIDQTGQTAQVELVTYRAGLVLQSEVFELNVPEGTDIVEG